MELTKQHKVLLGVLGIGALAVVTDRMLLGGATAPEAAKAATPAVTRDATPARENAPEAGSVADRLAAFASSEGSLEEVNVRDVFAARDADSASVGLFVGGSDGANITGVTCAGHSSGDASARMEHFRETIRLTSVILNPRPMAFIAGEKFEVDDARIVGGKAAGQCQHEVKLLEVQGPDRKARRVGSAIVLIDGKHRVELVIDR